MENNAIELNLWCRAKHGRTTQLAKTLGCSRQAINDWRAGAYTPGAAMAKKIEKATQGAVRAHDW